MHAVKPKHPKEALPQSSSPDPRPRTREQEAAEDLESQQFRGAAMKAMVLFGTLLVCAGGAMEAVSGKGMAAFRAAFKQSDANQAASLSEQNGSKASWDFPVWFPQARGIREMERRLIESSWTVVELRPRVQEWLTGFLRAGNSQVVVAAQGDLFFRKDCEYVTGAGFLNPERIRQRQVKEGVHADPVRAVVDFRDQLAGFGVDLVIVPVPVKPVLAGEDLFGSGDHGVRQNASFELFKTSVQDAGVFVCDPAPGLFERAKRTGEKQYLRGDTHWKPDAMQSVAEVVAEIIRARLGEAPDGEAPQRGGAMPQRMEPVRAGSFGDTFALLGLPKSQRLREIEPVTIHPVVTQSALWRPNAQSDVLLLGDSFSNIYSVGAMGWGEAAGFAEQLSVALGRSVDAMTRNSDGAFATRQMLQRELQSGRNRLKGKRIVVWEFAVRELMFGDWKLLPLALGRAAEGSFYCPPEKSKVRVSGLVTEVSSVPRPGLVPYQEHISSVHLSGVELIGDGGSKRHVGDCLVYAWSMREQKLTDVARLRFGDKACFEVVDWSEVASALEKYQRSECADPSLVIEPPVWGEFVPGM